jgi:hypothetical protein
MMMPGRALADCGIQACIQSRKGRKKASPHDSTLYRQRYRIENIFTHEQSNGEQPSLNHQSLTPKLERVGPPPVGAKHGLALVSSQPSTRT